MQERFAHSWVEAYIQGKWIRIDPTPGFSYSLFQKKEGILDKLRLYYDLLNHYYTRIILDYDYKKQKRVYAILKESLNLRKNPLKDFRIPFSLGEKFSLFIFLFLLLAFIVIVFLKYIKFLFEPEEKRLLKAFLKELKKRGYFKGEKEGIFEFIEKIEEEPLKSKAFQFARIYGEYYYKDRVFDKEVIRELRACLKELQNLK